MSVGLEELKRLAQAATPGPWSANPHKARYVEVLLPNGFSRVISDPTVVTDYDARFIAAANPATVLALIERVERAEAQTEERDSARALQADRARNAEREARFNAARADERNDFARRLVEAEARVAKLEAALNGLRDDVTGALAEAERQAKGASGMSVPYTGPFASGLRLPSVVSDLREQRRILDAALEAK